jgi:hypothetical protein
MSNSIVTAIQEKLGNSILTVRKDGVLLGRVLQDAPGKWIVLPPETDYPKESYRTLREIVDALIREKAN